MKLSAVLPFREKRVTWDNALLVIGASVLITLFGSIAIPLPFTPLPLATQPTFCLFLALFLGSKRATLAVLFFLLQGAMGLPVFSLGKAGILHLMGPNGGYLIGALLGTYFTGALYERTKEQGMRSAFFSLVVGTLSIFLCGWFQLSCFLGGKNAFYLGVLPFLIGDLLKIFIALECFKRLSRKRV